jgi:GMP synthase-like glutamine amidotransferase
MASPTDELVLIFDFGSQFGQLIARRATAHRDSGTGELRGVFANAG